MWRMRYVPAQPQIFTRCEYVPTKLRAAANAARSADGFCDYATAVQTNGTVALSGSCLCRGPMHAFALGFLHRAQRGRE